MMSPKAVLVGILITTILGLFHVFLGMPYIWVILFILVYLFSGPLVSYIAVWLVLEILKEIKKDKQGGVKR